MPVLLPLLIGGLAGAGGMLAGKQLAPKPTAASTSPTAAPAVPATPPSTASTSAGNTAAGAAAAIKQRRRARATPTLGTQSTLLGGTPSQQPQTLLGY